MSKPHPSMALTLDLDESIVDHELRLEIDRCYSYLGTPVVRTHEGEDDEAVNTLRMTVRVWEPANIWIPPWKAPTRCGATTLSTGC